MKTIYRGHEITVRRERCLAGYPLLYYTIFRLSDGYCCEDNFEDSDEKVSDMVQNMKLHIDAEMAEVDPWMEHTKG